MKNGVEVGDPTPHLRRLAFVVLLLNISVHLGWGRLPKYDMVLFF